RAPRPPDRTGGRPCRGRRPAPEPACPTVRRAVPSPLRADTRAPPPTVPGVARRPVPTPTRGNERDRRPPRGRLGPGDPRPRPIGRGPPRDRTPRAPCGGRPPATERSLSRASGRTRLRRRVATAGPRAPGRRTGWLPRGPPWLQPARRRGVRRRPPR